jgi:Tol biopolymer transport system component
MLGTVGYMSPEQVRRSPADHRSDIFSFGSVLYELLAGRRPFQGGIEAETMTAILNQDPPPLTAVDGRVSSALERIVRHCLEKRPEDRFQSARDVAFALESVAQGGTLGAVDWPGRRRRVRLAAVAGGVVLGLLAVGSVIRFSLAPDRAKTPLAVPMTVVPLTSLSGWERQPAFSPDGNQLAFSWDGGGDNVDIYVQLIGAGTPLRLTTDRADDQTPAWSPDGRYIAFTRSAPDGAPGIFIVPALGGPERKLQTNRCGGCTSRLDWSPDGKSLAFTDETSADTFGIFLLSVETLERRRLTTLPEKHQGDFVPAFSPDGRWVAFARVGIGTTPGLYVVPVAGGEPRRVGLGDAGTWGEPKGLTWAPDGNSILASWSPSQWARGATLWRVPASGGVPQEVGIGGDNARHPSISRRGNRLAFVQAFADFDIWEIGMSGSPPRGSSSRKLISSSRNDAEAQLSPDGTKIAFGSDRSGKGEVWICDRDGTNALPLTRFPGLTAASAPRWSPDGRRIALESETAGEHDIYVLEVAGGVPRRVTTGASRSMLPRWSADGRWIYFASARTTVWQVWKVPADGGPAVQVTRNGGFVAIESPDGGRLYYAKLEVPGIWSVPVNGGEERMVHALPPAGYWDAWDVGRQGLYVLDPEAKPRPAIELFDPATRRVTRIAELDRPPQGPLGFLSVSRDERSILYTRPEHMGSDIVMVEGFH